MTYTTPCPYYDGLYMDDPHYEIKLAARAKREGDDNPFPDELVFEPERQEYSPGVKGSSKLKPKQVLQIRHRASKGESHASLAREFGVSPANVTLIVYNKIWKEI